MARLSGCSESSGPEQQILREGVQDILCDVTDENLTDMSCYDSVLSRPV